MFITIGLVPIFARIALRLKIVDLPNDRKMHTIPIPWVGGLAMAIGVLIPLLYQIQFNSFSLAVLIGAVIIVVFGAVDDYHGLGYRIKFAGQIAAALVVIIYGDVVITTFGSCLPEGCLLPQWISVPLTLLVIVAVINAVNLADGLDGLAAGIMIQVFICITILSYSTGVTFITFCGVAFTGAIFGFLRFNTHPAVIFMGDTGSQLLGFISVTLVLALTQEHSVLSPFLPLLLLDFSITPLFHHHFQCPQFSTIQFWINQSYRFDIVFWF